MAHAYDTSSPADAANVADFPANERAERTTVQSITVEEHYEGTGFHHIGQGDDTARDAAIVAIDYYTGSAWVTIQGAMSGEMRVLAFDPTTPPDGWLECKGQAVSRTTYATLFGVIGTNFGVGDGSTTFNLPDMVGKYPVGFDSSAAEADYDVIGKEQGANTHALTEAETGSHTHGGATGSDLHDHDLRMTDAYGTDSDKIQKGTGSVDVAATAIASDSHTHTIGAGACAGDAHENRPASVVIGWVIKT